MPCVCVCIRMYELNCVLLSACVELPTNAATRCILSYCIIATKCVHTNCITLTVTMLKGHSKHLAHLHFLDTDIINTCRKVYMWILAMWTTDGIYIMDEPDWHFDVICDQNVWEIWIIGLDSLREFDQGLGSLREFDQGLGSLSEFDQGLGSLRKGVWPRARLTKGVWPRARLTKRYRHEQSKGI